MTAPELTLDNARKAAKVKTFRASDFLTKEEMDEVHESNIKGKKNENFDVIDAYIAEILARFGYDTYVAWKNGDISEEKMVKLVQAERVREVKNRLALESIIVGSMAGANNPVHGHAPKSLKAAFNIIKSERKFAEGN